MQEHAELGVHGDPVVAAVGDVETPLPREGDALRIVELAVALAATREHALGAALRIDDREQVVARVGDRDALAPEPGDAAQLLRVECAVAPGELDRSGVVGGYAPQHAAVAIGDERRSVRREREPAQLGEHAALRGLPAAEKLDLGLLCRCREAQ